MLRWSREKMKEEKRAINLQASRTKKLCEIDK
jgi:hypothetical protein